MRRYNILFIAFVLFSCGNAHKITIEGQIENFPSDSIFLVEAHQWDKPVKSSNVSNGKFVLSYDESEKLFLASLGYFDSNHRVKLIEFKNEVLSPNTLKYVESAFFLDSSQITVRGNFKASPYATVSAGNETKAFYRTQMLNFGMLNQQDSIRNIQLHEYSSIIKDYPNSNYLLSLINESKPTMKKNELEDLLTNFSKTTLKEGLGKDLKIYADKLTNDRKFENLLLEDNYSKQSAVLNPNSKINMIVVWASWCSPCRREIPELKKLYSEFKDQNFSITSISVDKNKEDWLTSLQQENMPWRQLIVSDQNSSLFSKTYEVGSIPYVLFLTGKGHLIKSMIGYDSTNVETYKEVISKYLD